MTLAQFVANSAGGALSYDGVKANIGQCEQLVCCYWRDVVGFLCPPIPAAKDLWTNPTVLASFDQIAVGKEQPGDVGVWGASSLINSPESGHTDIVLSPGFTGLDSNWGGVKAPSGYPAAHRVQHNYSDVLGFLRPKGGTMDKITKDEENVCAIMATGSYPGKDYNYQFTGLPLTQANLDKMLQFWQSQTVNRPAPNATKLAPGLYQV